MFWIIDAFFTFFLKFKTTFLSFCSYRSIIVHARWPGTRSQSTRGFGLSKKAALQPGVTLQSPIRALVYYSEMIPYHKTRECYEMFLVHPLQQQQQRQVVSARSYHRDDHIVTAVSAVTFSWENLPPSSGFQLSFDVELTRPKILPGSRLNR